MALAVYLLLTYILSLAMATFSNVTLDTGATFHMTGNFNKMSDLHKLETPVKILTGNGTIILEYAGTIYFKPLDGTDQLLEVKDTIFNPYMQLSVLSYGKLEDKCAFDHTSAGIIKAYSITTGKHLFTAKKASNNTYTCGVQVDYAHAARIEDCKELMCLASIVTNSGTATEVTMHRRFAHVGYSTLIRMCESNLFDGLGVTPEKLKQCLHGPKCDACMAGKLTKLPHLTSETAPRNTLHVDVCQIEHTVLSNHKYMAVALHEATSYSFVTLLATKDLAGPFTKQITLFVNTQTGQKVTAIRSDNGGENVNKTVGTCIKDMGIHHEHTLPYTPQQNGKAKRLNRTLQEMTRSALNDSKNPDWLWGEAMMFANFIRNVTLRPRKGIVPYT